MYLALAVHNRIREAASSAPPSTWLFPLPNTSPASTAGGLRRAGVFWKAWGWGGIGCPGPPHLAPNAFPGKEGRNGGQPHFERLVVGRSGR